MSTTAFWQMEHYGLDCGNTTLGLIDAGFMLLDLLWRYQLMKPVSVRTVRCVRYHSDVRG